ncbi:MAG: septum site-determining protein MinD [Candidatus Eremiobacteraeota bacterium]|nr:septum site-determining protein MinD [Candidatus Eremiobacteraeota bacterium]MBV8669299.1 septum site-determining protein MinD [Candidatus Eremiobacteraeota bacterium]
MNNDLREQPEERLALQSPPPTLEAQTETPPQQQAGPAPRIRARGAARERTHTGGRAIVVTSGKGGVGKTTVTANLGAALADAGKRVVVVDADVGLRNLDVVMGLENRVRLHSLDVIEERCTLDEALVRDRIRRSLMLLPAAQNRDKDEIDPEDMLDLVDELQEKFDIVLIDCPAGIEQGFRNAVGGAQEAIVVTTPEVSAVRDADRVAGLLPGDMPARLIINRVRPRLVRKGTMMSVDDVLDILRLDLVGVVPDDREVIVATNRGNPVIDISGSPTGAAIRRIAARLLGEDVPIPDLTAHEPWFARMIGSLRPSRPSAKGS